MPKRKKKREQDPRSAKQAVPPSVQSPPDGYRHWIVALIIVLTVAAYLPAMRGQLVWDDDKNVTKPELQSVEGLYRIWSDPSSTAQYYPLVHTMFWFEHKLWGDAPLGYHVVNVLWHSLSIVLVYSILRRLNVPGALLATAIFAVHPVMVESVAWITEQKNTLSAVFYLSSMRLYLNFDQSRTGWQYAAALVLFALALATKTAVVMLPVALLVILWWQRGRLAMQRDLVPLVPFFLLSVAAGLVTIFVEREVVGAQGAAFELTYLQRCLLAGRVVWFYLGKLLWPTNLTFVYPRWAIDPGQWWQWIFPVATIVMTVVLWSVRKRWRAPLAGWLFFCGMLFPVMGFLNVYFFTYSFVADHFQYLAALGVIAPAAAGLTLAVNRWGPDARWLGLAGAAVMVAGLAVLTMHQSAMYGNVADLYRTTIQRNPTCWLAYNNLGTYLSLRGHPAEAEPLFREAIRLKPDNAEALMNLGWHAAQVGKTDEAIDWYKRALAARPDFDLAELNWGNALIDAKRPKEAIEHYQAAARIDPTSALPQYNLGNTLRGMGDVPGAIEHYEKALLLKPDFVECHSNLGLAFAQAGRFSEAADQFEMVTRQRPEHVQAHHYRALALVQLKRDDEAIAEFQTVLQIDPKFFAAQTELAKAYARLQRPQDAISAAKKALATAQASGQLEFASKIEEWLIQYQAEQSKGKSTPSQP